MIDGCKIGVTLDVQPLDATYVSRTLCVLWKKQMFFDDGFKHLFSISV